MKTVVVNVVDCTKEKLDFHSRVYLQPTVHRGAVFIILLVTSSYTPQ